MSKGTETTSKDYQSGDCSRCRRHTGDGKGSNGMDKPCPHCPDYTSHTQSDTSLEDAIRTVSREFYNAGISDGHPLTHGHPNEKNAEWALDEALALAAKVARSDNSLEDWKKAAKFWEAECKRISQHSEDISAAQHENFMQLYARNAALEEAAKVADSNGPEECDCGDKIRALEAKADAQDTCRVHYNHVRWCDRCRRDLQ